MVCIRHKFTAHPVGQGLFYSGRISLTNDGYDEHFNFVFDCGSMNKKQCEDEINNYHTNIFPDNSALDLLVISHFDEDHVNHIYELLKSNRKAKKIVAPLLNFTERFSLLLKWLSSGGNKSLASGEFFFIQLILDPDTTLTTLLDGDGGEIIYITSDPDNPSFPLADSENKITEEGQNLKFTLDFGQKQVMPKDRKDSILATESIGNAKTISDSNRPTLRLGAVSIMEFLFYKKEIGTNESELYDELYRLFIAQYKKYFTNPERPTIVEITEIVKQIKTATPVKKLFKEAQNNLKFTTFKNVNIEDLNTTALCLLHRNTRHQETQGLFNKRRYFHREMKAYTIQKFEHLTLPFSRTLVPLNPQYRYHINNTNPNVFLTSDSFLLRLTDVDALYKRYKNYWDDYWLFQVPHHGSNNNADVTLFSRIPPDTELFINYGVVKAWGGKWRHPSSQVITDIISTGHSINVSPVHEYLGLEFEYILFR